MKEKQTIILKFWTLIFLLFLAFLSFSFYKNHKDYLENKKPQKSILSETAKRPNPLPFAQSENLVSQVKNSTIETIKAIKNNYLDENFSKAQELVENQKQALLEKFLLQTANLYQQLFPNSEPLILIRCEKITTKELTNLKDKKISFQAEIDSLKVDKKTYLLILNNCQLTPEKD